MHDDELAALVSLAKKQRKKMMDEAQFCLEPCDSPLCELCGAQMMNAVAGEEW